MSGEPKTSNARDSLTHVDHEHWQKAYEGDVPADLRDQIEGPASALRPAVDGDDPLIDPPMPEGGPNWMPQEVEYHDNSVTASRSGTITRDPSLSRAVDVEAAGGDPVALGMSTESEIGHPGPLGPSAEDQPAAAEGEPAGQWGSSGSPTS